MRLYPQIPPELIEQAERDYADRRMPVQPAQELLVGAVALTGDEDMGLKAARATTVGDYEVLEYVASSAATYREALDTFFRYAKLVNGAAEYHLEIHGNKAHVVLDSSVALSRVGIDYQSAACFVTMAHWVEPIPGTEVWFVHPRPADTREYEATFGDARLVFEAAHDGFVLDAEHLDTPLRSADPSLHKILRSHADRLLSELAPGDSLTERVRGHVLATMGEGKATAEHTAAAMRMSRRTLSRQLADAGTSFKELLADVRRRTAMHYLEHSDHSVEDIAFLLGFSESPPFVRAFRRWTGNSPLEYRRSRRKG
jgi:AraC-like DNA-binding protein